MTLKLLHLNIERDKHLDAVEDFLSAEQPDVACFCEIYKRDAERWASQFGYASVFSPLIEIESEGVLGSAILSKPEVQSHADLRYDDGTFDVPPEVALESLSTIDGNRPKNRFSFHASVLTATLRGGLTVATTHFPVTDHTTPGLPDHTFDELSDVGEMSETRVLFDRFLAIMRHLPSPLVFTADLNNPRGEYMYDALAHELIDLVPPEVTTTIDQNLHRNHGLAFVVDTIMTSPDVRSHGVAVRDGVSDHQALMAQLEV